jgi:hypothetical protein
MQTARWGVLVILVVGCGEQGDRPDQPPAPAAAPPAVPTEKPKPATVVDAAPLGAELQARQRDITVNELMGRSDEDLTATKATCDPAGAPTRAWAYQQYVAHGGEPHAHPYVHFGRSGRAAELWELTLEGGPDQPSEYHLAYVMDCRLVQDGPKLDQAILLRRGWKAADGAKRVELATQLDRASNRIVKTQPDDWEAARPFAAPEARALPGGGVELVRWIAEHRVISYSEGRSESSYRRQRVTYGASGLPSRPKTLATIKCGGNGRGQPLLPR